MLPLTRVYNAYKLTTSTLSTPLASAPNHFGELNYPYPDKQQEVTLIETLEALNELVNVGKVRYIGVSNETPWGVMSLLRLAEKHDLARIVSIQNPYNLLNRSFEVGLSEISHYEGFSLAYSPLAFGCLSGKYLNGANRKALAAPNGNDLLAFYTSRYQSDRSLCQPRA